MDKASPASETKRTTSNPPSRNAGGLLQRKCACGGTPGPTGECESCRKQREASEAKLQRSAVNPEPVGEVPPVVQEVLRSPGQPLDAETRAFMESRFGQDFSAVRVHTDSRAADSARAVDALAYTVGRDIVFGQGQYAPTSGAGRALVAHELAHTLQQSPTEPGLDGLRIDSPDSDLERAAERAGRAAFSGHELGLPAGREGLDGTGPIQPLYPSASHPLLIQRTRRPACRDDRLTREQYLEGVSWLEEQAHITTEEAERLRERVPDSRRARCRAIEGLTRRARAGREGFEQDGQIRGRGGLVSNLQVTPREINVDEGEAARISFDVTGSDIASISVFIMKYEFSSELPDSRFFDFSHSLSRGHKVAIWDGTFTGSRAEPPEPGTYRVRVWVSDSSGNREEAFEQIRVLNRTDSTVLPRTQSGLALRSMDFDGRTVVLTDAGGNQIRARAVSGQRAHNPHNSERTDYTDPQHQCVPNRGPIPAGQYFIDANAAQQPDLSRRGRLRYPSGASAGAWGPFRAPLRPANPAAVCGRSQFFFHLDVTDDGTAGCIGVASGDEARFNQMVALIMRIPSGSSLPVNVRY